MKVETIKHKPSFKSNADILSKSLGVTATAANLFIKSQENLSSTRFIQDTATNWLPKAVFTRSKEDFAEMSFLEFIESAIFYFSLPILGEKLFRNHIFNHLQPKNLRNVINKQIPNSLAEISKNKNLSEALKKNIITTKAGIVLACLAIPVAEYTLSFAKNLFTLKTFKKSNFNNIAKLDKKIVKNEFEDKQQQERVEKNAKKNLINGAILSALGLGSGIALAKYGHKSNKAVNIAKAILEPGHTFVEKFNIKNEKIANALKSISFDFANNKGKLALGKGQLGLTALVGLFGYSAAASDRGKLDVAEVWTRVPLVVFYTIFGSELFEKVFIKQLYKNNKYRDLITKDASGKFKVLTREQLPEAAAKIAKRNGTLVKNEFNKLLKQKTITTGIPYAFSLLFMGFTLSAITRLWTQYRYDRQRKEIQNTETNKQLTPTSDKFNLFLNKYTHK